MKKILTIVVICLTIIIFTKFNNEKECVTTCAVLTDIVGTKDTNGNMDFDYFYNFDYCNKKEL